MQPYNHFYYQQTSQIIRSPNENLSSFSPYFSTNNLGQQQDLISDRQISKLIITTAQKDIYFCNRVTCYVEDAVPSLGAVRSAEFHSKMPQGTHIQMTLA